MILKLRRSFDLDAEKSRAWQDAQKAHAAFPSFGIDFFHAVELDALAYDLARDRDDLARELELARQAPGRDGGPT